MGGYGYGSVGVLFWRKTNKGTGIHSIHPPKGIIRVLPYFRPHAPLPPTDAFIRLTVGPRGDSYGARHLDYRQQAGGGARQAAHGGQDHRERHLFHEAIPGDFVFFADIPCHAMSCHPRTNLPYLSF